MHQIVAIIIISIKGKFNFCLFLKRHMLLILSNFEKMSCIMLLEFFNTLLHIIMFLLSIFKNFCSILLRNLLKHLLLLLFLFHFSFIFWHYSVLLCYQTVRKKGYFYLFFHITLFHLLKKHKVFKKNASFFLFFFSDYSVLFYQDVK